MKFSVSSYSFQRLLNSGKTTQRELVRTVRDMGFDAIEFTGLMPENGVSVQEYAQVLRNECDKLSLPVANYTIGADLLNTENGLDAEVQRLFGEVETARILGAGGMRHDATGGYKDGRKSFMTFDSALPVLAEGCRKVTEYASKFGIKTMVENHGYFCQEALRVEKLVGAVDNSNFGLLLDMGNFLCADDDPENAYGRLAPFAKHIHAKDFHVKSGSEPSPGEGFFTSRSGNYLRGAIIGHGNVPVYQCLRILAANGYDGYVSIEFEGMEDNMKAIEIGLKNLKYYSSII